MFSMTAVKKRKMAAHSAPVFLRSFSLFCRNLFVSVRNEPVVTADEVVVKALVERITSAADDRCLKMLFAIVTMPPQIDSARSETGSSANNLSGWAADSENPSNTPRRLWAEASWVSCCASHSAKTSESLRSTSSTSHLAI